MTDGTGVIDTPVPQQRQLQEVDVKVSVDDVILKTPSGSEEGRATPKVTTRVKAPAL